MGPTNRQARGCPGRGRSFATVESVVRVFGFAALLLLPAVPAPAQDFGRWWWEGRVSALRYDSERLVDGEQVGRLRQTDLRLSLGLNGFLGHPAIGSFRLGLDLFLSKFSGGGSLDNKRPGIRGDFQLFPTSSYPITLFFSRQRSDYSGEGSDNPYSLHGLTGTTTAWGARLRLRSGVLRGTLIGYDHADSDYLDPVADQDVQDIQFVDWSRRGKKISHHARLERSFRTFSYADFAIEDLMVTVDERGDITPTWRWEMSAVGIRRDLTRLDEPDTKSDFFRMRNRLAHPVGGRDLLDIQLRQSYNRGNNGVSGHRNGLTGFYRWRPRARVEIAPFAELWRQSAGKASAWSPRAGVSASYSTGQRTFSAVLNGALSYGLLYARSDRSKEDTEGSNLAYSLSCSLVQGETSGLRKELEIEVGRNKAHSTTDPNTDLPDLGLSQSVVGTEDYYRLRLTLSRRWGAYSGGVWSDWSHRQSAGSLLLSDYESENFSATAQIGLPRFKLQGSAGMTTLVQGYPNDQDLRFLASSLSWRVASMVSLRAIYRRDQRQLTLVPNLDGEQFEAQIRINIGLFLFTSRAYRNTQQIGQGSEVASNGLTVAVSRNFAGWLPIVTGTTPRGEVF